MASLNLQRFSRPENLKAIRGDHLVALLSPFKDYFLSEGVDLPKTTELEAAEYERIGKVLMRAEGEGARGLLNTVYYVSELSDEVGLDSVLEALDQRGHKLRHEGQQSPADIAVQAWILDPELVRDVHAERQVHKKKSFDHFRPSPNAVVPWQHPTDATVTMMERAMDDWFEKKRRGRGCRVFFFTDEPPYWILVRHAKPIERAAAMERGKSSGVVFRPEVNDVLIYDPVTGDLRVNTSTQGELKLYLLQFGRHLFGRDDYFSTQVNFTLEPLRNPGVDALNCEDVEGIESIVLRQIELWHGGPLSEVEIHRADDVFAAFRARGHGLPNSGTLQSAKFDVTFTGAASARSVTIRLPISTGYVRDYDSTVLESWMRKQKFLIEE